ncbi:MAG: extracellular solute-binding protein [Candidatus Moranbacteria bacterium]|nr:extracellular solute-binding protein [Candidatus Moranbacteria bacterium]
MKRLKRIVSIFVLFFLLNSILYGCGLKEQPAYGVKEIEIWGVWDDSDIMDELIKQYTDANPQIGKITYRKMTFEEYEQDLGNAFEREKSPDIFIAHHSWLADRRHRMLSQNEAIQIYNQAAKARGGCSEPPLQEEPLISLNGLHTGYADVVYKDFVIDRRLYGMPLTVDTLALFYNEDLFSEVGIATPPRTWEELAETSQKLTQIDENGNIKQSGIALGTANNINRSSDIYLMLAMQKGSEIVDRETKEVTLTDQVSEGGSNKLINPALEALDFYASFSEATHENYTWNPRMHNSIDAFQEGKLAMMINYTYAIENIRNKAPKLNFKVVEIPQFENAKAENKIAYANYWGYVVSSQSKFPPNEKNKPLECWKFLTYLKEKKIIEQYVEETDSPAARKDVIEDQKYEPEIGVFAEQNLRAATFYKPKSDEIDKVIIDNLEDVALNRKEKDQAIKEIETELKNVLSENEDYIEELERDLEE